MQNEPDDLEEADTAVYQYSEAVDVLRSTDGQRIRGIRQTNETDFVLGGLFPIHTSSKDGIRCGIFSSEERGVERMEAMLYAIDLINSDHELLPNLTLGFDIRDTCDVEFLALDESLDLILAEDKKSGYCSSSASTSVLSTTSVIGASASAISVPVATLLRLFRMPQVSYASSSARLNDRELYQYFYRTVPADDAQAQAMVDIALRFKWTYVSVIYANDYYGSYGIDEFKRLASVKGICIDVDEGIDLDFTASEYQRLAAKLHNSTANVVILYGSQEVVIRLLSSVYPDPSHHTNDRFLWIASDAWAQSISTVRKFNASLVGMLGIVPLNPLEPDFHNYYSQLTASNNKRNPWFGQLYHSKETHGKHLYSQGSKVPSVINAVYSVAHALNNFLSVNCDQPVVWYSHNQTCAGQTVSLNGSSLLPFIKNVTFNSSTGDLIEFNAAGSIEATYNILNYQQTRSTDGVINYKLVSIGKWDSEEGHLYLHNTSIIQFGLRNGSLLYEHSSHCNLCLPGNISRPVEGSCCGTCDSCHGRNFSNETNTLVCRECDKFSWGNNPLAGSDGCQPIEESYLRYEDPWAISLLIIAAIGLLGSATVFVVLICYWKTVIIKSSSREQMVFLLVGIVCCFATTVAYVSKPSIPVCTFQRAGLWVCFSIILGSLLIKLIRIARIFLRRQFSAQLKCMGSAWQILFTLIVIAGQVVLVIISLAVVPPYVSRNIQLNSQNSLDFPIVVTTCTPPHTAMLIILAVYDTIILLVCNALAITTIRFPDNFNESKYVSFSTFSIGLIWLAFIPTFFSTRNVARTAVISFALNMSAFSVLACMFGPRLLTIVLCPERNTLKYMRSSLEEKTRSSPDSETLSPNGMSRYT